MRRGSPLRSSRKKQQLCAGKKHSLTLTQPLAFSTSLYPPPAPSLEIGGVGEKSKGKAGGLEFSSPPPLPLLPLAFAKAKERKLGERGGGIEGIDSAS